MSDGASVILTVDDDPHLQSLIDHNVRQWGYVHCAALDAASMWAKLARTIPSVILLDVGLGDADGTALIPDLRRRLPNVPVIVITAHATIEAAVKSLKSGAYDFVCKPLDFERLHIEVDKAVRQNRLTLQVKALESATRRADFHGMVGRSEPMRKVYQLIETVAPTDAAVLILGETGTGKELTARAIHDCSKRADGPFVPVNAPTIPRELIESAVFGHEKGAFTGAHQTHIGFCEQADGGTLFLDEICEMNYDVQAKLLRFLEDHVVQRVGAKASRRVDVRVIAATNREPKAQLQKNRLREDFYYRLSVVTIEMAPLRARSGDVPLLARFFLDLDCAKYGKEMRTISPQAMKMFESYDWPGNVRQLEHVIDQIVITNNAAELAVDMLPAELSRQPSRPESAPAAAAAESSAAAVIPIEQLEKDMILRALELTNNSIPIAARQLGLSEATLYRKLKKYGVSRRFVK